MALPNGSYYAEASMTLGLWANLNGTWTRVKQVPVYASGGYTSGGVKTLYWSISQPINATGDVSAFRVTIDSLDYANSGAISSFPSVTWQTQSTSGTRSATPNGETIAATVRPQ